MGVSGTGTRDANMLTCQDQGLSLIHILIRYLKWIQFWKEFYRPEPDEEWHELFTEALANERKINDYLDVLMFGAGEEIVEFFKMKRKEVERIEERINEYQREVIDGIRRYCERGDAYNLSLIHI